jgi:N-acetylglucosamine kinase-like BadF-type ATPase
MFVGLDLGGSGTRAALGDALGNVLATGRGGSSGYLGGAAGRRAMARALDAALAPIAPLISSQPVVIHAGVRGLSLPGRRETLALELSARFPQADVRISNDALVALWAGLAGQPGIAVLAGTGSIALARSADGREGRAGGWGYLLGDEGSGFWLGREALAAYLRMLEGRASTSTLTDLVATALGRLAGAVPRAIGWLNADDSQVARLANLAPLVSQAAQAEDALAHDILARAAQALADLAASAAGQLWPKVPPGPLAVACCGGVWAAGPHLTGPFAASLAVRLPVAVAAPPLLPPVAGALLLAMNPAPAPDVVERLKGAFA